MLQKKYARKIKQISTPVVFDTNVSAKYFVGWFSIYQSLNISEVSNIFEPDLT